MAQVIENKINEIVSIVDQNQRGEVWLQCRDCRWVRERCPNAPLCTISFAFLADLSVNDSPRIVFENKKGKGFLTLKDNLNIFYFCCRSNKQLKVLFNRYPYERDWYVYNDWTIVYCDFDTRWVTIDLRRYKRQQIENLWPEYNFPLPGFNEPNTKPQKITRITIICKSKGPPTLQSLCKIATLIRYMRGKKGNEFLPYFFSVSSKKISKALNLDKTTLRRITVLPTLADTPASEEEDAPLAQQLAVLGLM
jgi:hypothetical protein